MYLSLRTAWAVACWACDYSVSDLSTLSVVFTIYSQHKVLVRVSIITIIIIIVFPIIIKYIFCWILEKRMKLKLSVRWKSFKSLLQSLCFQRSRVRIPVIISRKSFENISFSILQISQSLKSWREILITVQILQLIESSFTFDWMTGNRWVKRNEISMK